MKKNLILLILPLMFVSFFPVSVSADTNAGIGPNSFFYFFDTTFEKVGLFFTFDSEKKAQKALVYADERLAEAEESANDNKPKDVEKAMEGYKKEISFATKKSKELKDETKAEELLNTVSESTAKHQEVLEGVLEKVPDEAKEAILKAIEVSKRGQEEAQKQISDLKKEVSELKQELEKVKEELENKNEEVKENDNDKEIGKLKKEIEELKQEVKQPKSQELKAEDKEEISETKKYEPKIVTFPNGSIVEMDENGNVIRTIKEAPKKQSPVNTTPGTTQSQPHQTNTEEIKITSINIVPSLNTATFEWITNIPTESRIFIESSDGLSSVFQSTSGFSTKHIVKGIGFIFNTQYSYEIEAISNKDIAKKSGSFQTIKETIPPEVTTHYRSNRGSSVSWVYEGAQKTCSQCLVIVTDEPTTIYLTYFNYDNLQANLSPENKLLWDKGDVNFRDEAINNQLQAEPVRTLTYTDKDLKNEHIISYDSLNLQSNTDYYVYKFEAKDKTGNVFKQKFQGSYGLPISWSVGQKLSK